MIILVIHICIQIVILYTNTIQTKEPVQPGTARLEKPNRNKYLEYSGGIGLICIFHSHALRKP